MRGQGASLGNQAVQRALRGGEASRTGPAAHEAARAGVSGPPGRLPHLAAIQRSFGPGFDLSGVRAHRGGDAAAASAQLAAQAYTLGDDVAFRGDPSLHTAAHEAAHVVQQRGGVDLPGGIGAAGDRYERQADQVADRVVGGEPAADLLPSAAGAAGSGGVQRYPDDVLDAGVPAQPPPPHSPYYSPTPDEVVDEVRQALAVVGPVAGVGDFPAAFSALDGLPMKDLMTALMSLKQSGDLALLVANFGSAVGFNQARLQVAMTAVMAMNGGAGPFPGDVAALPAALHALSPAEVNDLMSYLADSNAPPTGADQEHMAQEGNQVLGQEQGLDANGFGPSPMMMGGMYGPGFWMPGQIPIGYYIGSAAHLGIAAYYSVSHLGEVVYTNFTAIASILSQLAGTDLAGSGPPGRRPSASRLAGKPDIANMTLHHLYEIKPAGSEAQALAEAEWYQGTFAASGIEMALGPSNDPGVNGVFYDIGWYFIFDSPMPGVVTYRRQAAPPPVPVPETQPSEAFSPARDDTGWHFSLPRLSREQAQAMIMTVTVGAGLIMLAYIGLAILAL
jgi:hypothetical protein